MVKNLKYLRTRKGISQQQLASVLGISQQSVNKYENHNIEPDIATLSAIADYFNTSIDFLVGRHTASSVSAVLTQEEEKLISGFRTLSGPEQICVSTLIQTYQSLTKKP